METQVKMTDAELLQEIQDRGYFVAKTPLAETGKTLAVDFKKWGADKYRFGVVSDTHLGSRYQQVSHLRSFYRLCQQRQISTVFHCGDLVDGERMYRGQEYEIFVHGADAQRKYAVKHYPKAKNVTTIVLGGNHDASFQAQGGYDIVSGICAERGDMVYLGSTLGFTEFAGVRIALMHGSGGNAYARSYKGQKIAEQFAPPKPNMLFLGHYHCPVILSGYRNMEVVQVGCFQAQTPYLASKGLYPFIAGLIVTFQVEEMGLASVMYETIPFYVPVADDY